MRTYNTITIPARDIQRLVKSFCDLCKKEIVEEMYDINDATVEKVIGSSYPDCGEKETTSYDVCMDCFDTVIVPLFGGVKPTVEEYDW